jgi:peroxiredoxin
MIDTTTAAQYLQAMMTQDATSVYDLSIKNPVLLVFLRHFGCTFCREALSDIAEKRQEIEATGVNIVFVHMADDKLAERYFNRYNLTGIDHVSDPSCEYYAAFGLTRGNLNQLFGLKTWLRGFNAGVVNNNWAGPQLGDGFQMPGIFVIQDGQIRSSFIHKYVSDRPDYEALVKCCALD